MINSSFDQEEYIKTFVERRAELDLQVKEAVAALNKCIELSEKYSIPFTSSIVPINEVGNISASGDEDANYFPISLNE